MATDSIGSHFQPDGGPSRIGLLGGTFDPPHVGHLVMAIAVREAMNLDTVLLVVAGDPWQKSTSSGLSAPEDRLEMTRAAVADVEGLEVSEAEVCRAGPTYTVETLQVFRSRFGAAELFFILGADALAGLRSWHRYEELGSLCRLVVVDRPGTELDAPQGVEVTFVEAPRLEVSSTELRRRVALGRSLDFLVPPGVISVIEQRGLYACAE